MANGFIKATRVVNTALGVLNREVVLPQLVWRDAAGNFAGAKDDTISIRVPSTTSARRRTMRTGGAVVVDELNETKVDVTLNTNIYKAVGVSLEEQTLDVTDFEAQVSNPATEAVGREVEDLLAEEMSGATYRAGTHTLALDASDPWQTIVQARTALNKSRVPAAGRYLAVGADAEEVLLKSDRLSKLDVAGDGALREASLGALAGFRNVVSVPGLDPDVIIAFHMTAFVLSMQAPAVPRGAVTGASRAWNGLAMTAIQDYDQTNMKDRFVLHTFAGTNNVTDFGHFDAEGRWIPGQDEDNALTNADDGIAEDESRQLIRAVKMTLA